MITAAIKSLFIVRNDCYPKQIDKKNEYTVVKENLTYSIIRKHLDGFVTIGAWQTNPETKKVKWVCFDFDGIIEEEYEKSRKLFYKLKDIELNPLMEFSGRRGYHIWLFIEPVDIAIARKFVLEISKDFEVSDVYPRNDKIEEGGYGSQVKLPLGIHRVSMKRSFLFDDNLKPLSQIEGQNFLIKLNNEKRNDIFVDDINNFLVIQEK